MRSCLLFSSRLVSFQSGVENLLCDKKGSLLQFCNCGRQLDESLLRRKLEDCDGKYCRNSKLASGGASIHIVHEDGIYSSFKSKLKGLCFSFVQPVHWSRMCHGRNLKPWLR